MSILRRQSRRERRQLAKQAREEAALNANAADESVDEPQLASEMPEIELEAAAEPEPDSIAADIVPATSSPEEMPRRRAVKPRSRTETRVRWGVLFSLLIVIVVALALLLNAQNVLPAEVLLWWPLALLIPGVVWLFGALVQRSGRGMLSSAAVIGVGISLLLGTQSILPVGSTLVGIVLISAGTSILLRGLLLGRQPITQ
ncbi:MAG: hypothetical protein KF726_07940 [Anaerolineae bacterium]|nr:hypothetical protein [Anaerolineae bacterium]